MFPHNPPKTEKQCVSAQLASQRDDWALSYKSQQAVTAALAAFSPPIPILVQVYRSKTMFLACLIHPQVF